MDVMYYCHPQIFIVPMCGGRQVAVLTSVEKTADSKKTQHHHGCPYSLDWTTGLDYWTHECH